MTQSTSPARPIALVLLVVGLIAGARLATLPDTPPPSAQNQKEAIAAGDLACVLFNDLADDVSAGGADWSSVEPNHLYRVYEQGIRSGDDRLRMAVTRLYGDASRSLAFDQAVEDTAAACRARGGPSSSR